jgi:hypothetical protein
MLAPMPTERERRIALNEAAFRIANERMLSWEERDGDAPEDYLCECADPDCRAQVPVTRPEYEAVRANPLRFLIVPGHEVPDVEDVVERHERYAVVEKPTGLRAVAERTDPRSD